MQLCSLAYLFRKDVQVSLVDYASMTILALLTSEMTFDKITNLPTIPSEQNFITILSLKE